MQFLIFFALLIASGFASDQVNPESKLINGLLKNYDARVRPVKSRTTAVPLKFGLGLADVEEGPNNVFSFNGWTKMYWIDEYLQWTPAEHSGIDLIKFHPFISGQHPVIWMPDITIYSGKIERREAITFRAYIQHTGNVTHFQQRTYKVPCYPVAGASGKVTCKLLFASWVHPKSEIDVQLIEEVVESYFDAKSVWKLNESKVETKIWRYNSYPDLDWPHVEILLTLQKTLA